MMGKFWRRQIVRRARGLIRRGWLGFLVFSGIVFPVAGIVVVYIHLDAVSKVIMGTAIIASVGTAVSLIVGCSIGSSLTWHNQRQLNSPPQVPLGPVAGGGLQERIQQGMDHINHHEGFEDEMAEEQEDMEGLGMPPYQHVGGKSVK